MVLIVDDALDELGYTVRVATSGEAALQRARQAVPDIVLLDAMMPGTDGFEVARQDVRRAGQARNARMRSATPA